MTTHIPLAVWPSRPVGYIVEWVALDAVLTEPRSWMRPHGQYLSSLDYPELFAVLGYRYGGCETMMYFRLPDLSASVLFFGDQRYEPLMRVR